MRAILETKKEPILYISGAILFCLDKVIIAFTLFALSACFNLSPKYERSELPVPSKVSYSIEDGGIIEMPEIPSWEDFYTDKTLQVLIKSALEHNRDFKIATSSVRQLQALYELRKFDAIPNISSSLSFTESRLKSSGLTSSSRSLGANYLSMTAYEIDFWGRVSNLKKAAQSEFYASLASRRTVEISIINGTAEAYLLYMYAKKNFQLHESTVEVYNELLALVEKRNEVGIATASDLAKVKADLARVQAAEAQIEKNIYLYIAALQLIVGTKTNIDSTYSENEIGTLSDLYLELPENLSSLVLLNRPDVIAAEHSLIARHADIGAARAAFLPTISLSGSINGIASSLDNLFKSRNSDYTIAVRHSIFGYGRKANLQYAQARQEEFLARYEKAIQTAFSEVYTQIKLCEAYDKELQANQARVAAQKNHLKYIQARYDAEISSYTEILSALEDLVDSESAQLISERNKLLATIQLYKALGGGTQGEDEL